MCSAQYALQLPWYKASWEAEQRDPLVIGSLCTAEFYKNRTLRTVCQSAVFIFSLYAICKMGAQQHPGPSAPHPPLAACICSFYLFQGDGQGCAQDVQLSFLHGEHIACASLLLPTTSPTKVSCSPPARTTWEESSLTFSLIRLSLYYHQTDYNHQAVGSKHLLQHWRQMD